MEFMQHQSKYYVLNTKKTADYFYLFVYLFVFDAKIKKELIKHKTDISIYNLNFESLSLFVHILSFILDTV